MSTGQLAALAFALGCAGCAVGAHTRAGGAVGALSVREVAWNPTNAATGYVRGVADVGEVTAVFADTGVTVLSSGAVLAVDHSRADLVDAAVVPGAAEDSPRMLGVSRDGHVYQLVDRSHFENVSGRYGLENQTVRSVAALGNGLVAFLLEQRLAIADGNHVRLYDSPGFSNLLGGGGGNGLVLDGAGAFLFDALAQPTRRYPLAGVTHGALGSDGRLYVSTTRAIYAAVPGGDLELAYDSQSPRLGELVASHDTAWFTDGRELGIVEGGRVAETSSAPVSAGAKLLASGNGDVWVLSTGTLRRFSRFDSTADRSALWVSSIAPIFARVCAGCHQPRGVAGIDLSSAAAWEGERAEIRRRVLETRTMPPQGQELEESERTAIAAWLRAGL